MLVEDDLRRIVYITFEQSQNNTLAFGKNIAIAHIKRRHQIFIGSLVLSFLKSQGPSIEYPCSMVLSVNKINNASKMVLGDAGKQNVYNIYVPINVPRYDWHILFNIYSCKLFHIKYRTGPVCNAYNNTWLLKNLEHKDSTAYPNNINQKKSKNERLHCTSLFTR